MATQWDVGMLLGVSTGYWKGCALQAAVRLKIFSHLSSKEYGPREISEAAGTDLRATGLLLDALVGMGLLKKSGSEEPAYTNTDFSSQFLDRKSKTYVGHIILHHHHILDGWAQLDRAVTTGKKVERRGYGEEMERESFLMGMFNLASMLAPKIATKFSLEGRKKLLDLGGGPGTYAIWFCRSNPDLTGVVYDRPTTEPFARKTVAEHGLTDRIDFIGGDFNIDEIPGGPYDVAWMSHILHSNSYEQCVAFIKKVTAALEVGGMLMIHDFILNNDKDGPEFPALFALNMLVGTESGRSYSKSEIMAMLEEAGLATIEHHKLEVANDSSIITAVKP